MDYYSRKYPRTFDDIFRTRPLLLMLTCSPTSSSSSSTLSPASPRAPVDEAARQRKEQRLKAHRSDCADALGLFEKFFKLRVTLPRMFHYESQAFIFPLSYTVDQIKVILDHYY